MAAWQFLHPADDLSGKDNGQQGIADSLSGYIAQGEQKYRQITDQVDPLDGYFGNVR